MPCLSPRKWVDRPRAAFSRVQSPRVRPPAQAGAPEARAPSPIRRWALGNSCPAVDATGACGQSLLARLEIAAIAVPENLRPILRDKKGLSDKRPAAANSGRSAGDGVPRVTSSWILYTRGPACSESRKSRRTAGGECSFFGQGVKPGQ